MADDAALIGALQARKHREQYSDSTPRSILQSPDSRPRKRKTSKRSQREDSVSRTQSSKSLSATQRSVLSRERGESFSFQAYKGSFSGTGHQRRIGDGSTHLFLGRCSTCPHDDCALQDHNVTSKIGMDPDPHKLSEARHSSVPLLL